MGNTVAFFVFCTIIFSALSLFMEGENPIATTTLTAALAKADTTALVVNTSGFINNDFFVVDNEEICYTGTTVTTFTGLERGCRNTKAADHPQKNGLFPRVYNDNTGFINRMVGFNVLQTLTDDGFIAGTIELVTSVPDIARGFARMAIWDFAFFEGSLVWIKYLLLFAISSKLVFDLFQMLMRR